MKKRLCKSADDKMLAGVCGGIAEYLNLDPTLIRIAWVIFCAMGGAAGPQFGTDGFGKGLAGLPNLVVVGDEN